MTNLRNICGILANQMVRQVVPVTIFATSLNAPCTSLRLAQPSLESTIYLIVGKSNGETIFFPTDRSECISKFENEEKVPITAITDGDMRNLGSPELVTITANGNLTSLSFPCGTPSTGPVRLFSQQVYPNICSAELADIDGDGLVELIVVMTDRVVRSYRYVEELTRMLPLNKWEMPAQISGWSIGAGFTSFALLSQSEELHYIHLDFGPNKDVQVHQTPAPPPPSPSPLAMLHQDKSMESLQPPPQLPLTQLVVAKSLLSINLHHFMVRRVLLVNEVSTQQVELHSPGGADVACCSAAIFPGPVRTLTTCDPWGQLNVYAWSDEDDLEKARIPVASCRVMRDADFICCSPGPNLNDDRLLVGVVNIFNRIAIYSIDMSHVLKYNNDDS